MNSDKYLIQISEEELFDLINSAVDKALENYVLSRRPKDEDENPLYTRHEVAGILQITLPTLYNWVDKNVLPKPVKIGSRIYFQKKEIDLLIRTHGESLISTNNPQLNQGNNGN